MRPRNLWAYEEPDALMLAVSYMQGIAMAHAFEQETSAPDSMPDFCS